MQTGSNFRLDMTQLLNAWQQGDKIAESRLFEALHSQLKQMCRKHLGQAASPQVTLGPTEMFNELYLRLDAQTKGIEWANRQHFFYCG